VTEHLQRPNIQTYALCTFTSSLQTFTIFLGINAFINVYYNVFDVYHIYEAMELTVYHSPMLTRSTTGIMSSLSHVSS